MKLNPKYLKSLLELRNFCTDLYLLENSFLQGPWLILCGRVSGVAINAVVFKSMVLNFVEFFTSQTFNISDLADKAESF